MAAAATYVTMNGMIVYENRGGVERDYVPDTLGSTVALLDSSQTKTDTWRYWPYGEVAARTGTNATPFTFVGVWGYFKDILDKLIYVRASHYLPDKGRWLTVDPLPGLGSLYGYCNQSPANAVDPSGLQVAEVMVGAGGVVIAPEAAAAACVILIVGGLTVLCCIAYDHCRGRPVTTCSPAPSNAPSPSTRPKPTRGPVPLVPPIQLGCASPCPPDREEIDTPPTRPHYFKKLGGCCYGTHSHIIRYHQKPFPDCSCFEQRVDGTCYDGFVPGPCIRT